jgi:hypothetical protein
MTLLDDTPYEIDESTTLADNLDCNLLSLIVKL